MKIVFVTQALDRAHPVLAATVDQVAALAERADEVVVLAESATGELPGNCRLESFRSRTRAGRGLRFEAALARELHWLRGNGAVVAHMCPIYAVLAAPLTRPLKIPVALWFAHWRFGALLRAAERAATVVVTVDRRSFPLQSGKVRAIGHGIDVDRFPCSAPEEARDGPLRVLALGRYSRAKGFDTMLRALAGSDARLTVHGPALTDAEREHRRELERLSSDLGLEERVTLGDAVPRTRVPALFAEADVLVDNMLPGAPDKVVYEAAASCLPVIVSNPLFDDLVEQEQRFARDDPADLASRLASFAGLRAGKRAALGRKLRARVVERHSVDRWAQSLVAVLERR